MSRWRERYPMTAVLLAVVWATAVPGPAVGDPLTEFGMQMEAARVAAAAGDQAALDGVSRAIGAQDQGQLAGGREGVLALLRGNLHFAAGAWRSAAREFGKARGQIDDRRLQAAAAFQQAEAQAAEWFGQHNAKESRLWHEWLDEYPDSPLACEARLRLIWIDLREGRVTAAKTGLADLAVRHTWLPTVPEFRLVQATLAFLTEDYAASLDLVAADRTDAAPIYLAALCRDRLGQPLAAAADYQQVTMLFPTSELGDAARFAKANTYLKAGLYRSASEEFAIVAATVGDQRIRAEAELRQGAAVHLDGDQERAARLLREVIIVHAGTDVAARGQFLLGEVMTARGDHAAAIVEYTRVLTSYFDKSIAASAQYRLGRCYAALGRPTDAIAAYMAVVSGYPQEPEAPAAAYMAGKALLEADNPRGAVPYFQLVLDRYARRPDGQQAVVFARPEHQELVEASLCMLELAWHRVGDLGQLTGAPHALLQAAPPSTSFWRAWTILIDADAMASQGNHAKARASLESLTRDFQRHPACVPAQQLLAWTYAQQGEEDLAIATSEDMLARYTGQGDLRPFSQALLNVAHVRFNQNRYREAATAYEDFLGRHPDDPARLLALYQAGLCYLRLDRGGDAVDRWQAVVREAPFAPLAEKAWARAGDLYFQADRYDQAKECYEGLLANFRGTAAAGLGQLRIAQCDFNAGRDAVAITGFEAVIGRGPDPVLQREAERGLEMALYRMGQGEDGVAQLRRLLEQYPQSSFAPDAQFRIADRLYERQQFAAAAEEFRRVVSLYPGHASADRAQFLQAESWERSGDDNQALRAYGQLVELFAGSSLRTAARFRSAMIHFNAGVHDEAAGHFSGVLDGNPEPDLARAALFNLGLCRQLLGDLDQAAGHFRAYQARFPGDERQAAAAFQLGDILDRDGRVAEAIEAFRAAARAKPEPALHAEIYFRMGGCFEKQDNARKAIEAYSLAAKEAAPDNAFRLSAVARCAVLLEDAQRFDEALASYHDLMNHASDPELAAAARGRAAEISAALQ